MMICKRGHELAGDNLYVIPSTGKRRCRRCRNEVYEPRSRQSRRDRLGLPPASPHVGRYAIKQGGRT